MSSSLIAMFCYNTQTQQMQKMQEQKINAVICKTTALGVGEWNGKNVESFYPQNTDIM